MWLGVEHSEAVQRLRDSAWSRDMPLEGTKSYAVGLEMSCPGGAYDWAPEIPSDKRISRRHAEHM